MLELKKVTRSYNGDRAHICLPCSDCNPDLYCWPWYCWPNIWPWPK